MSETILTIPVGKIVEDAIKEVGHKLADFDPEERAIVERAMARAAVLAGRALFATPEQRPGIEAEALAIGGIVASLAEKKAATASRVLEDFVAKMFQVGSKLLIAALA